MNKTAHNKPETINKDLEIYFVIHQSRIYFKKYFEIFIFSLDPDNDPLCAILLIDFYAIRSGEYDFLVRLYNEWEVSDDFVDYNINIFEVIHTISVAASIHWLDTDFYVLIDLGHCVLRPFVCHC